MGTRFVRFAVALIAFVSVGVTPAEAKPTVSPSRIAGTYAGRSRLPPGVGWNHFILTLRRDHTGTDDSHPITWSTDGKNFTLTETRPNGQVVISATGVVTKLGISRRGKPGTFVFFGGPTGLWYAVKTE